jgi:hypothetical protein
MLGRSRAATGPPASSEARRADVKQSKTSKSTVHNFSLDERTEIRKEAVKLRGRELNPGLPRDRRKY